MASESPKWIALVLSVFAITISGLSWWEAHRNRIINEEINRPVLEVGKILVDGRWRKESGEISFKLAVKNIGRSTASVNSHEIKPLAVSSNCEIGEDTSDYDETLDLKPDILPGAEYTFYHVFSLPLTCRDAPALTVGIIMTVQYTDLGSGKQYSQEFHELTLWKPRGAGAK